MAIDDNDDQDPNPPAPEGDPAPQPGGFSLPDSWKKAGFDFEKTDPEQVREAQEFHSRYKGKRVFDEREAESYAQQRLTQLLSDEKGQQQIEAYLKALRGQKAPSGDERLSKPEQWQRQVESQLELLAKANKQLYENRERDAQQNALKAEYNRVDSSLKKTIGEIPGADRFNENDWLARRFWQDVMTGDFGDQSPTENDVRKWVKKQVDFLNKGFARSRKATPVLQAGSTSIEQKLDKMPRKDAIRAMAEAQGLVLDGDE